MTPAVRFIETPRGRFRALEWPGDGPGHIFLHGLTGVSEVWAGTIAALSAGTHALAIDQRGHGDSVVSGAIDARSMALDVIACADAAGMVRPHLAGHSMGARVALVAAARFPDRWRSVAIVDIGPEAWAQNWRDSWHGFDGAPDTFPDLAAVVAMRNRRGPESLDAGTISPADRAWLDSPAGRIFVARFRQQPDGTYRWHGDRDAWRQMVRNHRARNYWAEWEMLGEPPALLIRGGNSNELRAPIAEQMRRRNPRVFFEEYEGVGHNIPLIVPGRLAVSLTEHWRRAGW